MSQLCAQSLTVYDARTGHVVTVEDHYAEGGLGDAVRSAFADNPVAVWSVNASLYQPIHYLIPKKGIPK